MSNLSFHILINVTVATRTEKTVPSNLSIFNVKVIKEVVASSHGNANNNNLPIRLRELENLALNLEEIQPLPKPKDSDMHDRWIVVTSIFAPTEDIKLLAAIPGWKMVVVGDKKSPKEYK